jgi:hypothetical protein
LWSGLGAIGFLPIIAKEEAEATIAALKPPKRQRPLIAIIGINHATEATDYLMPYGILRRADIADVDLVDGGDVWMIEPGSACASLRRRRRACGSAAKWVGRNFSATSRPRVWSSAR